jgi:hypothetical protein
MRPLWPFLAGGAITWYYIAKIQHMGVSSECTYLFLSPYLVFMLTWDAAPEALKDPKNPYAPSIAKQQQQAHH